MQYINRPYQPSSTFLSSYLKTRYIDPPSTAVPGRAQSIDLALWPSQVTPSGQVRFSPSSALPQGGGIYRKEEERMGDQSGKVFKPDLVVFATGYKTEWGWVGKEYRKEGVERVRDLCDREDVSAGFIGFVRPGVGELFRPPSPVTSNNHLTIFCRCYPPDRGAAGYAVGASSARACPHPYVDSALQASRQQGCSDPTRVRFLALPFLGSVPDSMGSPASIIQRT